MRTKTGAAIVTLVLAYCLPMADAASMRSDGVQRLASLARRASQKTIDFFSIITNQMQSSEAQSNQLTFTLENGAAASDPFSYQTAGLGGPLLLQSTNLLDTLAHFVRERIPERVVHARGLGAHGTVEITTDFAEKFMCSPEFKMGQKHPATCRFSTVGGASGSPDLARDPRGFACKIRTKSGTLDWVFNNTPIFFIRVRLRVARPSLLLCPLSAKTASHERTQPNFPSLYTRKRRIQRRICATRTCSWVSLPVSSASSFSSACYSLLLYSLLSRLIDTDWIWQNPESLHQMFVSFAAHVGQNI